MEWIIICLMVIIQVICTIKTNRKIAKVSGLIFGILGFIQLMINSTGYVWVISGLIVYFLIGWNGIVSVRTAFLGQVHIFYLITVLSSAIGLMGIEIFTKLGNILWIFTVCGHLVCWLTSPITLKLEK